MFSEIFFTEMDDGFLDSVFEDLVFSTDVEIVEEMFFPFSDFVFLVDEVIHVLKILVNVELFPEHRGILHR